VSSIAAFWGKLVGIACSDELWQKIVVVVFVCGE